MINQREEHNDGLLYGGIAIGLIAGVALATYLWKQRATSFSQMDISPLERAQQLIESCENKLESIEHAITDLRAQK
jgi:hypothetical protein